MLIRDWGVETGLWVKRGLLTRLTVLCVLSYGKEEYYLFATFSWEEINSSALICHRHKMPSLWGRAMWSQVGKAWREQWRRLWHKHAKQTKTSSPLSALSSALVPPLVFWHGRGTLPHRNISRVGTVSARKNHLKQPFQKHLVCIRYIALAKKFAWVFP